jgi:hypothetical protein
MKDMKEPCSSDFTTRGVNPFPLIRETWDCIGVETMLQAILPKSMQGGEADNPLKEPAFLAAFDEWHAQTEGSTQGLLNLVLDLRPAKDEQSPHENIQWDLLTNGIDALDLRLQQFEALLHWARMTWEYDPQIYAAIKSQEIDGEDPSEDPSEDSGTKPSDSDKVLRLSQP